LVDQPNYDSAEEAVTIEKHRGEIHGEIHSEIETAVAGKSNEIDEDFEVMGGGDAVLSAVIAVWLGLRALDLSY